MLSLVVTPPSAQPALTERPEKAPPPADGESPPPREASPPPLTGMVAGAAMDPATLVAAQEQRDDSGARSGDEVEADGLPVPGPEKAPTVDSATGARKITRIEQQEVARLAQVDAYARAHERAHSIAGGPFVGMPHFSYQRGPDGKMYAVDGRVSIDAKPLPTPEATVRKMQMVIRAALAPLQPSGDDMIVASIAQQTLLQAKAEIAARHETTPETPSGPHARVDPARGASAVRDDALAAYRRTQGATTGIGAGTAGVIA